MGILLSLTLTCSTLAALVLSRVLLHLFLLLLTSMSSIGIIPHRKGDVLNMNAVLKQQYNTGYFQVPKLPLYSTGSATRVSSEALLQHAISCASSPEAAGVTLWLNLREAPLVYINGIPFVLRRKGKRERAMFA
jgi:hypothetical protein